MFCGKSRGRNWCGYVGFLVEVELDLGPKGKRGLRETKRMCSAGGPGRTQKEGPLRARKEKWILTCSQGRYQRTWNHRMESPNLPRSLL